jgi:hypothetical protein
MSPLLSVLNFVRMNSSCPLAAGPNNTNPYSDLRRKSKREFCLFITVNSSFRVTNLHSPRVKVVDV